MTDLAPPQTEQLPEDEGREAETTSIFPKFSEGQRVLCVGVGGSLDIVAAAALANELSRYSPRATLLFGGVDLLASTEGWESAGVGCMFRRPAGKPPPSQQGRMEWLLSAGPEGSPLLFRLPQLRFNSRPEDLMAANLGALCPAFKALRLDAIIAIDVGGDALTGGGRHDARCGQDWQVMHAIVQSEIEEMVLLIVGLGVDGESTERQLSDVLERSRSVGAFRGCAEVAGLLLEGLCSVGRVVRDPSACPNIVAAAACDKLPADADGRVRIPRNRRPAVPLEWAKSVFAFDLQWALEDASSRRISPER